MDDDLTIRGCASGSVILVGIPVDDHGTDPSFRVRTTSMAHAPDVASCTS